MNRHKQRATDTSVASQRLPVFVKENYNGAETCVHSLVEAQAEQTPYAIAARFQGQAITYRELDERAILSESNLAPASGVTPDDLAYLIYTSGSTGKPKGVAIPHCPVLKIGGSAPWT